MRHARTDDLVAAFRHDPDARFGADYIEQLRSPAGEQRVVFYRIDLVFSDVLLICPGPLVGSGLEKQLIGERVSDAGIPASVALASTTPRWRWMPRCCTTTHPLAGPSLPRCSASPSAMASAGCAWSVISGGMLPTSFCGDAWKSCSALVLGRAGLWSERHWLGCVPLISCCSWGRRAAAGHRRLQPSTPHCNAVARQLKGVLPGWSLRQDLVDAPEALLDCRSQATGRIWPGAVAGWRDDGAADPGGSNRLEALAGGDGERGGAAVGASAASSAR